MVQIDITPVEGDTSGAYTIAIHDDEGEGSSPGVVGTVHPIEPAVWEFKPSAKIKAMGLPSEGSNQLIIRADGIEQLRAAFRERYIALEVRSTLMSNKTMQGHTFSVVRSLNILATKTDSNAGFFAGVADAMAHSLFEDFPLEHYAETRALLIETLDKCYREVKEHAERAAELHKIVESGDLKAALGALIERMQAARGGAPDDTTKH